MEDTKKEVPVIERKHEWEHGDAGSKDCWRKQRPVFTAPNVIPSPCRNEPCKSDEWNSKGYVLRDKKKKTVVYREQNK